MERTIQIEASHFVGSGAKPWLIVGRVPGDDDDTAYLVLADDQGEAQEVFTRQLHEDSNLDDKDLSRIAARYSTDVIVTSSTALA